VTIVRTGIDSWVDQAAPTVKHGTAVKLSLNGPAGTNDRRAFVHFARPFPLGATILSAKLRLFAGMTWTGQTITAKRVIAKWSEALVTWNNAPAVTTLNQASVASSAAAGGMIELDVTAMLQDVSSGIAPAGFFGFRLELGSDVTRSVHSAEATNANLRPLLEVTWSMPPDGPVNLAPAAGLGVSLSKPILAWVFRDRDAGAAQASSQVQISTSADFTTPEYDSGKVANTAQLWDLAPTAYAGLAADAVRFWRVRVWDDTDIVSAWSDAVSFTRKTQGTLAITSPSGATVDDLSPRIAWTLTGRTQEAYRVLVFELPAAGPPIQRHDSGKITSTDLFYTVPEGIIVSGPSYRVELRVFDTIDRQAIPLDPDYTVDTQDFTYSRSGAPAAVTSLTAAASPAGGPGVQLDFSRSAQPDYFALKVDGVEVVPRIDPADVFVSGTSYRFTYWGATPRVSHTYEVEAVVNSGGALQHSDANSTANFTTTPTGIWLVDEDDGLYAKVVGQQTPGLGIGESGTTHYLRGKRAPVRITDTVRGYEGDLAGQLRGKAMRDAFLELKGRLKVLRLVVGDVTIRVVLEDVSTAPTPLAGDRLFGCTFGIVQVDDFTFDVAGG
jgi:hypothetical protein